MPVYMKFQRVGQDKNSDILGGVTMHGYDGWIAIESISVTVKRQDVELESDDDSDDDGPGGSDDGDAMDHLQGAMEKVGRPGDAELSVRIHAAATSPTPASSFWTAAEIDDVTFSKRLDAASAKLFRWAARDTSSAEAQKKYVPRDIVVHLAHPAYDGSNNVHVPIAVQLKQCVPKSYDISMEDGASRAKESITFSPRAVVLKFRETTVVGKLGQKREAEFDMNKLPGPPTKKAAGTP